MTLLGLAFAVFCAIGWAVAIYQEYQRRKPYVWPAGGIYFTADTDVVIHGGQFHDSEEAYRSFLETALRKARLRGPAVSVRLRDTLPE